MMQSHLENPTPKLRFMDGALQQYWSITTIEDGMSVGLHGEWRDIPEEFTTHLKEASSD